MQTLSVFTPLTLGSCGCTLETGDAGRPLFVPCRLHTRAGDMLAALREAHSIISDLSGRGVDHPTARRIYDLIQQTEA